MNKRSERKHRNRGGTDLRFPVRVAPGATRGWSVKGREGGLNPDSACAAPMAGLFVWGLVIISAFACTVGIRGTPDPAGAAAAGTGPVGWESGESDQPPADTAGPEQGEPGPQGDSGDEETADLVIGAVLPVSGPPSLREYARLFIEGLETGVLLARKAGLHLELVVEDNQGTASGSVRGAASLVTRGALAILGPLDAGNMGAAARAVPRDMVFLSPTVRRIPYGRSGVYSIAAGDPRAGRILARTVWELGFANAVIVHPRSPREGVEMDAFQRSFVSLGGVVRRRIRYAPGTTTFDKPLSEVKSVEPSLLVVAAPPGDLELLAPQIAFFGLDETDLQVAGTTGWTAPPVIDRVARRHTDGVVALSTVPPGAASEPPAEFVAAYETLFRRSLNSSVPATGFDLLRMAVRAYDEGALQPAEVAATLERIGLFEGATGTYAFADGRLTRRYFPVRIFDGSLHPVGPRLPPSPPAGQ